MQMKWLSYSCRQKLVSGVCFTLLLGMNKKCVHVYLNVWHSSGVIKLYLFFHHANIHLSCTLLIRLSASFAQAMSLKYLNINFVWCWNVIHYFRPSNTWRCCHFYQWLLHFVNIKEDFFRYMLAVLLWHLQQLFFIQSLDETIKEF